MKITPILGEPFRYWCQSETNPEQMHLVDLIDSECGCASFTCRARAHKEKTGRNFLCKHLIAVRNHALDEIIEGVREQLLSK